MPDRVLNKIREICLQLPDTKETLTWGEPHFRVGEKIFCGCGQSNGVTTVGFKLEKAHAARRVKLPGFSPAPYVGRHGWVSLDANFIGDWSDVSELIMESYRLIAPKSSLAKLEQAAAKVPPLSPRTTNKTDSGAGSGRQKKKVAKKKNTSPGAKDPQRPSGPRKHK